MNDLFLARFTTTTAPSPAPHSAPMETLTISVQIPSDQMVAFTRALLHTEVTRLVESMLPHSLPAEDTVAQATAASTLEKLAQAGNTIAQITPGTPMSPEPEQAPTAGVGRKKKRYCKNCGQPGYCRGQCVGAPKISPRTFAEMQEILNMEQPSMPDSEPTRAPTEDSEAERAPTEDLEAEKTPTEDSGAEKAPPRKRYCANCGGTGHRRTRCPNPPSVKRGVGKRVGRPRKLLG